MRGLPCPSGPEREGGSGAWQILLPEGPQDPLSISCSNLAPPHPARDLDTVESVRQKLGELTDLHGLRR